MLVDGFTKPLSVEKHTHFIKQLGLVNIASRVDLESAIGEDEDVQISSDSE